MSAGVRPGVRIACAALAAAILLVLGQAGALAGAGAFGAAGTFGASAAFAETAVPVGPALSAAVADYSAGIVRVSVEASSGLSAVGFFDGSGSSLATISVQPADTVVGFDLVLRADTAVHAVGYGVGGEPVWEGAPLALSPSDYAPRSPKIAVRMRTLVGSNPAFRGRVLGDDTTRVTLQVRGRTKWSGHVGVSDTWFSLPRVSMPYGRSTVAVIAANGFGSARSPSVIVYNLGAVPSYPRFALVDKSDLRLYWITSGRVEFVYPVAIGMPATPTRTGTFKLGRPQRSGGSYGVLRMPLLKRVGTRYRPTSYYIHGTNAPWSIGTMASHGCVRNYNRNIRWLARVAPGHPAVIRK